MKRVYIFILAGLLACASNNPNIVAKFPQDPELKRIKRNGSLFNSEDGIVIFQDKIKEENNIENQLSLWKESLKTISQLLPISIADQKNGLIITEWGNIKNYEGLYKINIIIMGDTFDKNNIVLTVFKKLDNQKTIKDKEVKKTLLDMIFTAK